MNTGPRPCIYPRTCSECTASFLAASPAAKRCSDQCFKAFRARKDREYQERIRPKRFCGAPGCGLPIAAGAGYKLYCETHRQANVGHKLSNERYRSKIRRGGAVVDRQSVSLIERLKKHKPCANCGQLCMTQLCIECSPVHQSTERASVSRSVNQKKPFVKYAGRGMGPYFKPEGIPWFPGWNGPYSPNVIDPSLLEKHFGKVYP